jgi:hypothetical protein
MKSSDSVRIRKLVIFQRPLFYVFFLLRFASMASVAANLLS